MVTERSREEAVAVLRRARGPAVAREAKVAFPDPVVFDRDRALLAGFGLSLEELIDDMGGSP